MTKIKFAYSDRRKKDKHRDGEIISRTGGVLALLSTPDVKDSYSVTHTLTGASLKFFTDKRIAQKFARSFYRFLNDGQKQLLCTSDNPTALAIGLGPDVGRFVRDWKG